MINTNDPDFPREIRDYIELKSMSDPTFYRATEEDYTDILFETLNSRAQVDNRHSYICSIQGRQGGGKSYTGISICKTLDPNFSVDRIFFNYNDLVYNKQKLRPGMAVLVDEQQESFGLDSHRVNVVLTALKEQLRKKSIHFVFCSPTLKPEYQSSQYVMETMFIDYQTEECYLAYQTRELLTLGYVRIPNPLSPKVGVTQEFMDAYEAKKDEHLDRLTGNKQYDEIEERVSKITSTDLFKMAEKVYVNRMGYMPMSMLFQIINKLFPEFKSSIIVGELASRIKLNKEMSGQWEMSGITRKKKDKDSMNGSGI